MKKSSIAISLTVATVLAQATAHARPIEQELRRLVAEHPLVSATRKTMESGQHSVDAAQSAYLPRVSLSGDYGAESIVNTSYNGAGQKIGGGTPLAKPIESELTRNRVALVVEQNLYTGGRTEAQVGIAQIELEAAQNSHRATVQNVLLEGITAYLQVARYQLLIAIAKRNEETTQQQLNLEDERVSRGGGIAVDVLQAKTRLQIAKERRVFNEQNLRDAVASYRQVFGKDPQLDLIQDVDLPTAQLPASLDAALQSAQSNNPAFKESLLQSQKALKQVGGEKVGFLPSVSLVGFLAQENNAGQLAQKDEKSVLLKMNWNLYAGGETRARTAAAEKNLESTVDRELATLRKVQEAVQIAWHQMVNGRERQELLENAANISFEVMQNRKRLRDAGKESAINVLDAEVEYYSVQANRINAMYDTRVGGYRVLASAGALSPETLGLAGAGKSAIPAKPLEVGIARP